MKAWQAAVRRIIENHRDEYAELLRAERVAVGLPAQSGSRKTTTAEKIAKLEAKIAELRAQDDGTP